MAEATADLRKSILAIWQRSRSKGQHGTQRRERRERSIGQMAIALPRQCASLREGSLSQGNKGNVGWDRVKIFYIKAVLKRIGKLLRTGA